MVAHDQFQNSNALNYQNNNFIFNNHSLNLGYAKTTEGYNANFDLEKKIYGKTF